jgi:Tat protein translocase TatB subunit
MSDIGFWEIALTCAIALLVVGPERLPGLIREVMRWTSAARRFISTARREFENQLTTLEADAKIENPLPRNYEDSLASMDKLMQAAPDRQEPPIKESQKV